MIADLASIPVVIFAGGRGSRFDHESQVVPKPMIEVAGKPILEHIIESLELQGLRRFIVASGYLSYMIIRHFRQHSGYVTHFDGRDGTVFGRTDTPSTVLVAYTGDDSHTGRRLWEVRKAIGKHRFMMTYGDGLSNVDMAAVITQHERAWTISADPLYRFSNPPGPLVTMTVVHPPGRFGIVELDGRQNYGPVVQSFCEKPSLGWINGGFMVAEPEFIEQYIEGEFELESTALRELAACERLQAYRHEGFWMCMDTRRDREQIEAAVLVNGGRLPWLRSSSPK